MVLWECDLSRCHSRNWKYPNSAKQRLDNGHNAGKRSWSLSYLYTFLNARKPTIIPIIYLQRPMRLPTVHFRNQDLRTSGNTAAFGLPTGFPSPRTFGFAAFLATKNPFHSQVS